jgi:hypothetical protein
MNSNIYWYVLGGLVLAAIIGYLLVKRARVPSARNAELPTGALPRGWQFYSNPTTLEPPGTIFRIDANGVKYQVASLEVAMTSGEEAVGKVKESIAADSNIVARFIGLPTVSVDVGTSKTEHFVYELTKPVMESTTDAGIDKSLASFLEDFKLRTGERYFVIRQARKASGMRYRLTRKQLDQFGGEVSVSEQLSAKGKVLSSGSSGDYVLEQDFPVPMRIIFLPQEIAYVTAGLAADEPQLGLLPVGEVLHWQDAAQNEGD